MDCTLGEEVRSSGVAETLPAIVAVGPRNTKSLSPLPKSNVELTGEILDRVEDNSLAPLPKSTTELIIDIVEVDDGPV